MTRIPLLDAASASPESRAVLDQIQAATGTTTNMFKAAAHSPAALKSLWSSFAVLAQGVLDAKLAQKIAVAVAQRNGCDYCLMVHMAMGRKAGASAAEMAAARWGEASEAGDTRTAAALGFAAKLVEQRGQVSEADLWALRHAGFVDAEMVEIVAQVAVNLFANYLNLAFAVPLEFAAPQKASSAAR
ncbi:carboxymuconolactone decarboxylase family protein [Sphaerotilaceae bacterium SBD11-9]